MKLMDVLQSVPKINCVFEFCVTTKKEYENKQFCLKMSQIDNGDKIHKSEAQHIRHSDKLTFTKIES